MQAIDVATGDVLQTLSFSGPNLTDLAIEACIGSPEVAVWILSSFLDETESF